jgi:hypothetical protein
MATTEADAVQASGSLTTILIGVLPNTRPKLTPPVICGSLFVDVRFRRRSLAAPR